MITPRDKVAKAAYDRERYLRNKPVIVARVKTWQEANKDKVRTYEQRSKEKRRPLDRAYNKDYMARNKARTADVRRQRLYGVTSAQVEAMLQEQDGRCAICNRHQSECSGTFHVDHSHRTGQAHRVLCRNCNTGLGFFNDSPELLRWAATYLELWV